MDAHVYLPEPPLWCRIILTILTIPSFSPQILRIQSTQSIRGISPLYILWNLVSATEQLAAYFYSFVNVDDPKEGTIFLHQPPSTGDWFSLYHCAVVTIMFLILFIQILLYSDRKFVLGTSYASFLLISMIPLLIDATFHIDDEPRMLFGVLLSAIHLLLVPIITIMVCLGIYRQAREINAVSFPNSLSLQGLRMQAIIFMLVSVAWIWCVPFPYRHPELREHLDLRNLSLWYSSVGWEVVNSFLFTFGQALFFVLASRRVSSEDPAVIQECEREPLLG